MRVRRRLSYCNFDKTFCFVVVVVGVKHPPLQHLPFTSGRIDKRKLRNLKEGRPKPSYCAILSYHRLTHLFD